VGKVRGVRQRIKGGLCENNLKKKGFLYQEGGFMAFARSTHPTRIEPNFSTLEVRGKKN